MNAFEGVINDLNTSNYNFIEGDLKTVNETYQSILNLITKIKDAVEIYKETGDGPKINYENWEVDINVENKKKHDSKRNSYKENIQPNENVGVDEAPLRSRPRRNAFKEASQCINQQFNTSLSQNLRKRDDSTDNLKNVQVKLEKTSPKPSEVKIKTEIEKMPAPSRLAPRKKKQKKTESKIVIKQEKLSDEYNKKASELKDRASDVIIQNTTVTMVNLLDDENEKTITVEENVRSTRSKTRNKKIMGKRTRQQSSDEESTHHKEKRSRSRSDNVKTVSETKNDDPVPIAQDPTVNKILEVPQINMNTTVVIEKPKYVPIPDDLMTDDESDDEKKKISPPKTVTKANKPKPLFSPFESSPVKKKVQAFEKLRQEANAIPVRITRTKTRANAAAQEETESNETESRSTVKEKTKLFTPTTSKFIPTASSTVVKVKSHNPSLSNESFVTLKSASALKASQAEYRERERKRREKEQEALKKREALIQAQIEEKKKKREEKQLKAQQQREILEKEKQKNLEAQRLKEERHKQLVAEQEEKKQKLKEEMEKKRLLAKMRAMEEKKKEQKRYEDQKKLEMDLRKPIYLTTKPPLLPTPDCYDSDDEEYAKVKVNMPSWTRSSSLIPTQYCMIAAREAVKNSFFSRQAQTPDLQEIFEVIESKKLKRSSSAMWLKAPRYTMMSGLEEHAEVNEELDFD